MRYKVSGRVPDPALAGFMILLFAFPVFFNLSVVWLPVYWFFLLYTYHRPPARWSLSAVVAVIAVVMPVLTIVVSCSLYAPQSERMMFLWKGNYGYCPGTVREQMEECALQYPGDIDLHFTLGLVHKREQNYVTALGYYDRVLAAEPRHVKALVNSGNVYLATERWDAAVGRYREALSVQPESAAAHFNLARAYQQKFMFAEAEQELTKAKQYGSDLTDYYLEIYSENYNRLVVDMPLDRLSLYKKALREFGLAGGQGDSLWNVFFAGLPIPVGSAAVIVLFIANLYWYRKDRFRIAVRCSVCGKPICRRCEKNAAGDVICAQCMTFLNKHDKLGFKEKETKAESIRRYLKRYKKTGAVLSAVIPGAGHVWNGMPVQGVLILLVFWTLIFRTVFALVCDGPWEFAVPPGPLGAAALVVFAAALWAVLAWAGLRTEGSVLRDNLALRYLSLDRD
jgi:tetratricopeptide (TPR) repeat protein